MRNFIRFVSRFFNLILFIGLEVLCAVLIARTNSLQGGDLLSSSNAVSGYLYKRQSALVYYFGLGPMNDSLLRENARLRDQLARLRYSTDTLRDSTGLAAVGKPDSTHIVEYARYTFRSARVINNSVTQRNNYITIDRGLANGIAKDMSVISGTGVVGKVVHVSAHFATVLSVLSSLQTVSAQLRNGTTGQVTWIQEGRTPSPDVLYLPDIPAEETIRRGDSVWTTTYSFFPPGVMIGTVTEVRVVKKTGKHVLLLRPATNFRNMMYVYVAENTYKNERRALEAQNMTETPKPKPAGRKKDESAASQFSALLAHHCHAGAAQQANASLVDGACGLPGFYSAHLSAFYFAAAIRDACLAAPAHRPRHRLIRRYADEHRRHARRGYGADGLPAHECTDGAAAASADRISRTRPEREKPGLGAVPHLRRIPYPHPSRGLFFNRVLELQQCAAVVAEDLRIGGHVDVICGRIPVALYQAGSARG